jgi:hypothetical protein
MCKQYELLLSSRIVQIPANEKHCEVHWSHGKYKMEDTIIVWYVVF